MTTSVWLAGYQNIFECVDYVADHYRVAFTCRMRSIGEQQIAVPSNSFQERNHLDVEFPGEFVQVGETAAREENPRAARLEPFNHDAQVLCREFAQRNSSQPMALPDKMRVGKGVKPEVGIGAVHFILDARFAAYAASAQGDEPALNVKPGNQPPV